MAARHLYPIRSPRGSSNGLLPFFRQRQKPLHPIKDQNRCSVSHLHKYRHVQHCSARKRFRRREFCKITFLGVCSWAYLLRMRKKDEIMVFLAKFGIRLPVKTSCAVFLRIRPTRSLKKKKKSICQCASTRRFVFGKVSKSSPNGE